MAEPRPVRHVSASENVDRVAPRDYNITKELQFHGGKMTSERVHYLDLEVISDGLETIGTVTDVLYNEDEPKWLVVKPGVLRSERYVPVQGSYETQDGHICVPFDKRWIKSAPKARDHVMSDEVEHRAAAHYQVAV
jgi:hypothetical protein